MKPQTLLLAMALVGADSSALAAQQFGEGLRLSGFGTLGVASSDNKQDAFVRDGALTGATDELSWKVDSKLGLQADITATSWMSATVQVLAEQRYASNIDAQFEWAFVKLQPLEGLSIRLGRMAPATFMVSDSRNVGYANTAIRMPNEVYSLALLRKLQGADVSYRMPLGGTTLTASVAAGTSRVVSANFDMKANKTRGLNLTWDTDVGSFRLGRVKTDVDVALLGITDPYTFSGVGYQLDDGHLVLAAEWVRRTSEKVPDAVNSKGWYAMAGVRIGSWLPYASVAKTTNNSSAPVVLNGAQDGVALGVRWDMITNAALKLQFDRADPKGTSGVSFTPAPLVPGAPARSKTNVLSVALDFVF